MDVLELSTKGTKNWQDVNPTVRDVCEDAVENVKQKVQRRRILIRPIFRDYDKSEGFEKKFKVHFERCH